MLAVRLYPPTEADIVELAENLREGDKLELERETGSTDYLRVITEAVKRSPESFVMVDAYGRVVALFGCSPVGALVSPYGAPWCLGTDQLFKQASALMLVSRRYIHECRLKFPALVNYVDAENDLSIKFLAALGFHFDEPAPYGARGALFHRFWQEGIA